jgi:recombinational DNA repair ATPase RecF
MIGLEVLGTRERYDVDATLLEIVSGRLAKEGHSAEPWARLTLAACIGEAALAAALENADWSLESSAPTAQSPAGIYVHSLTVEGFRGVGDARTLAIGAGPGLVLVVGRNGSGKSSFAEAIELLLTGENRRWSTRSKIWKEGWRNLHHQSRTFIRGEFTIEGDRGTTAVSREWPAASDLEDGHVVVQRPGKPKSTLEGLNWKRSLELYRPFLSYNELGATFDEGPTILHDRLSSMLGLEDLVDAQKALAKVRLSATHLGDAVRDRIPALLEQLQPLDDGRARKSVSELSKKKWNLGHVSELLVGPAPDQGDDAALRQLAEIDPIDLRQIGEAVAEAREVARRVQQIQSTPSEQARELAALLKAARIYVEKHAATLCPVCEKTGLDRAWSKGTLVRVEKLQAVAEAAEVAARDARAAGARVRSILRPAPTAVVRLRGTKVNTDELAVAWRNWIALDPSLDLEAVADHLEKTGRILHETLEWTQKEARAVLADREDSWRRVAQQLGAWVEDARVAQEAERRIPDVRQAEKWLKDTASDVRRQRFAPIANAAMEFWRMMRQQSNVDLEEVGLEGSGTSRRPALRVEVDGVATEALSVMSQGELHSVALSLFLPRATSADSPFRFVVIDDPVQSMDPARVEGLARVLERVARDRQVIVFTHDGRLPEVVRRLGVLATIVGVARREGSIVDLRNELDPVSRAFTDARALARTAELPRKIAERTVPGFCRAAVEAACDNVIRRRRLGRGENYGDVETLLLGKTLSTLTALALFDDPTRGADVLPRLNREFGAPAGDVFIACNKGAHEGYQGDLEQLVRRAEKFTEQLQRLQ